MTERLRMSRTDVLDIGLEAGASAALVFAGAAVVCWEYEGGIGLGMVGVALASGGVLWLAILATAWRTGGLVNPCVTVASVIVGRVPVAKGARLCVAQLAGAATAGVILRLCFPNALGEVALGVPTLAAGVSPEVGIGAETIAAFAWVVAMGATLWNDTRVAVAAPVVAGVHTVSVLAFGGVSGCGGNTARAFGPAFASGVYEGHSVYWIGPILGTILGASLLLMARRYRFGDVLRLKDGGGPPTDVSEDVAMKHYRTGVRLYREGRLEESAGAFASATKLRPHWAEPYFYIGMVYGEFGDEGSAAAFFDAALHYRGEVVGEGKARKQGEGRGECAERFGEMT